jgi:hypothetical protein
MIDLRLELLRGLLASHFATHYSGPPELSAQLQALLMEAFCFPGNSEQDTDSIEDASWEQVYNSLESTQKIVGEFARSESNGRPALK